MTNLFKLLLVISVGVSSTIIMCCSEIPFDLLFIPIGFAINSIADYGIYIILSTAPIFSILFIIACTQQVLGYNKLQLFLGFARFFGIIASWGLPLVILCNNCRGSHTIIP